MIKELNRNYKQNMEEVMNEFPDCHILMVIDNELDDEGKVIAISDDPTTENSLLSLRSRFPKDTIFFYGGIYKNASAIGLQTVI